MTVNNNKSNNNQPGDHHHNDDNNQNEKGDDTVESNFSLEKKLQPTIVDPVEYGIKLNQQLMADVEDYISRETFKSNYPRIVVVYDNDSNNDSSNNDDKNNDDDDDSIQVTFTKVVPIQESDRKMPERGSRKIDERYVEISEKNPPRYKEPSTIEKGDCQPVEPEWQLSDNMNCNVVHEASGGFQQPYKLSDQEISNNTNNKDVESSNEGKTQSSADDTHSHQETTRLVNWGAYRQVWMIRDHDGVTKRAMKTLLATSKSKKFDLRNQDRHRRDAVSFDRLTWSPLIVDIYAHCSNTAIFDYADGGDLFDLFEARPDISRQELLQIAYNASLSVHHAHNFNSEGKPTLAHTDIKPDQFIFQDGYYKLSDFNRVRFLMWNRKRDLQCGFHVGKNGGEYRSPEEYSYQAETEKVDVFSLGNVLYYLLTRHEPWEDYKLKQVYDLVKLGQRPKIPDQIYQSTHIFERYMIKAMEMAWIHEHTERPGALEVANAIKEGLDLYASGVKTVE